MSLSLDQIQLLDLFVKCGALLGMVGEIGTLAMFLTNPQEFYTPMGHLVLALCGADILGSIGKGIGRFGIMAGAATKAGESNSILCLVQASMIIEADDITITIIFMMTWMVVYLTFFTTKYEPLSKQQELIIIIIAVLLPFPPIIWTVFGPEWIESDEQIIGNGTNWCYIRPIYFWTYQFIIYYFWQWGLFVFNLISITAVYWRLRSISALVRHSEPASQSSKKIMFVVYRMSYYLIAYIVGHLFSNAARISQRHGEGVFALILLQGLISPARGMLNFCAFMFSFVTSPARTFSNPQSNEISGKTSTLPESYDDQEYSYKI